MKVTKTGFYFESDYKGYDDSVNYKQMLEQYNQLVESGRVDEAKSLMKKHGGVIIVLGNIDYQKGRQK